MRKEITVKPANPNLETFKKKRLEHADSDKLYVQQLFNIFMSVIFTYIVTLIPILNYKI